VPLVRDGPEVPQVVVVQVGHAYRFTSSNEIDKTINWKEASRRPRIRAIRPPGDRRRHRSSSRRGTPCPASTCC
jgi:hypothetical protein